MIEFCNRLKRLRIEKRLTQRQLAAMIGVQHTVISFYEVGDRIPSVEILVKLATVLHVTTDYLLGVEKRDILDLSDLSQDDRRLIHTIADTIRQKEEYKKGYQMRKEYHSV